MDLYVILRRSGWRSPERAREAAGALDAGRRRGHARRHPLDPQLRPRRGRRLGRHRLHLRGVEPRGDPQARQARRPARRRDHRRRRHGHRPARSRSRPPPDATPWGSLSGAGGGEHAVVAAGCPSADRRLQRGVQIETRYARNGDATIAWTAAGDAPTDLLFVPGFISHVEHLWEQPGLAGFFERLMGFTRLLIMDRRGCGLSDPRRETRVARGRGARRARRPRRRGQRARGAHGLHHRRPARHHHRRDGARARAGASSSTPRWRARWPTRTSTGPTTPTGAGRCGRSSPRCGGRAPTSRRSRPRGPTTRA